MNARTYERVAIVLNGALGDIARAFIVPSAIRAQAPHVHITWICDERFCEVVRLHPAVDEIVIFERQAGVRGLWRLRCELLRRQFDVSLDLQRIAISGIISFLTRAPRRIGFARRDAKELNWVWNTEFIRPTPLETTPKLDDYRSFISALGLACDQGSTQFGITRQHVLSHLPRSLAAGSPYGVLVLGSSWQSKNWVGEGYSQLISALRGAYTLPIVLVGTKSDISIAQELMRVHGSRGVVNLCGATSLPELCAVLAWSRFACGPDSGPGHVCALFGVPYIGLFGPTSPERTAPAGSLHLSVRAPLGCAPCYRRSCPGLDRACMRLVAVRDIVQRVASIYGGP